MKLILLVLVSILPVYSSYLVDCEFQAKILKLEGNLNYSSQTKLYSRLVHFKIIKLVKSDAENHSECNSLLKKPKQELLSSKDKENLSNLKKNSIFRINFHYYSNFTDQGERIEKTTWKFLND